MWRTCPTVLAVKLRPCVALVQELVALANAKPGALAYAPAQGGVGGGGVGGGGEAPRISPRLFRLCDRHRVPALPTGSPRPFVADLLTGQCRCACTGARCHAARQAGPAFAPVSLERQCGPRRLTGNCPTLARVGFAGFDATHGTIAGPAGSIPVTRVRLNSRSTMRGFGRREGSAGKGRCASVISPR